MKIKKKLKSDLPTLIFWRCNRKHTYFFFWSKGAIISDRISARIRLVLKQMVKRVWQPHYPVNRLSCVCVTATYLKMLLHEIQ